MPVNMPVKSGRLSYLAWSVLVALFFLIPLGFLLSRGIDFGDAFFDSAFNSRTLRALGNTILLASTVALSTIILGVALAWVTTRTNMFGRRILSILAPLPLAVPSFVGAVALILGFAKGGLVEKIVSVVGIESLPSIQGFWGVWFALTLFTYPYVYLPTRARFLNMPRSEEESALLLGKSQSNIFFTIVLPQTMRSISSGALLVFLYTISDFGAVAILRYNTLTQSIFSNRLINQSAAISQAILLAVVGLLVVSGERTLTRKQTSPLNNANGVSNYRTSTLIKLGKLRLPVTLATFGFFLISLIGPIVVMIFWVFRGIVNRGRVTGSLAIRLDGLLGPIWNTVYLGIITGLIAMIIIFPVARFAVHHKSKVGKVTSGIISSSFGLPGLIIALAMVYWVLQAPTSNALSDWLYQTLPLMIGAYIIHLGAQAMGSAEVAIASLPKHISEASQTLGAGRFRRLFSVELPLMAPVLATGVGLVMLSVMKELPITLLLSPTGFSTLATDIWAATEERALAQAGLVSLILIGISGLLSWLVIFRARGVERLK